MPGQDASFFDARNLIDDNDLQRQIDEAQNIPVIEELRLVIRDVFLHGGPDELNARQAFNEAKVNALRKARKKLVQRLRAEAEPGVIDPRIPRANDTDQIILRGATRTVTFADPKIIGGELVLINQRVEA